jgi:hypothetical protein
MVQEADEQFLERLRVEVEPVVGGWARLAHLRLDRGADGTRIIVALETPSGPVEVECAGDTLIEAAGTVATRLGETRLERAFRELVLPDRS